MVALENLDLPENLAPSSPLPLGSTLLKSSPQSHFFQPPLPISRGYILCLLLWEKVWTFLQEFILQMSESHAFAGTFFLQKKIMELPFKTLSVTNFWIFCQVLPLFFFIFDSPLKNISALDIIHIIISVVPHSQLYTCVRTQIHPHTKFSCKHFTIEHHNISTDMSYILRIDLVNNRSTVCQIIGLLFSTCPHIYWHCICGKSCDVTYLWILIWSITFTWQAKIKILTASEKSK